MPSAVLAACCAAVLAAGPTYDGRARQLDVPLPRLDSVIVVDGRLDEAAWREAARLTGFSRYAPTDGVPADDDTEVLVWYAADALHVGIRARAEPGSVRATLADRDRIFNDDHVTLYLGTFNDGRQATVLSVNPFGVQGDGILVETGATEGGFGGLQVGRETADLSPNVVFQSKGRLTDDGFEVELRIPFKSLTYQSADVQAWTLNVARVVQSRGFEYSWAPAARGAASYLGQSGRLTGLRDLDRGLVLDVNPVVTNRITGVPAATTGAWGYAAARPEPGMNVRWGITNNLTLNGTYRPDFAEVEADAGQFVFDPRSALFFPERRPFFLDGIEQFTTPSNLVYTRRVLAPLAAGKVTGKIAGTGVALLSALDDAANSETGTVRPLVHLLRLQRDLGGQSRAGLLLASKEEGAHANRVAAADARLVFTPVTSAQLQLGASQTTAPGRPARVGPIWNTSLNVATARFGARYLFRGIADDFVTRTGFIARPSIVQALADHRFTRLGAPQALFQKTDFDVVLDGTWRYRDFVRGTPALEQKLHLNLNTALRGGWSAGGSVLIERFNYDDGLYADYAIERTVGGVTDTVPFRGVPGINNLDYVASIGTPQFAHWSFGAFAVWGHDENFFEWAPARIGFVSLDATFRPTDQLRGEFTYRWQWFDRVGDGSRVGQGRIPRLKVEYQFTRAIFLRLVGQYVAQERDSLRNVMGAGEPILIRNADGVYDYARGFSRSGLRADWLFSYLPSPGTVVFAGYGSSLEDERPFALQRMRRTQDGFFVKVSYLFRL